MVVLADNGADGVGLLDAADLAAAIESEPAPARSRPAIRSMQVVNAGPDVVATVTLGHARRQATGLATQPATHAGVYRAVALATLQAVEELVDQQVSFELDRVDLVGTPRTRTVVAGITIVSERGGERLTGAAVVRADVCSAVMRASLDAVNRRIERLLA